MGLCPPFEFALATVLLLYCKTVLQIDNRCEVVRCPAISTPANGRFKDLRCDNKYRSTCGVLCNEGYDIVGTQHFECGLDKQWRNEEEEPIQDPFCQSKYFNL